MAWSNDALSDERDDVQSRAPLNPYHRLFCPSVWMNCSLSLGKLSTCLLSLASLQKTGRML